MDDKPISDSTEMPRDKLLRIARIIGPRSAASAALADMIETVARALKPAAFKVFDEGYPAASNIIAVTAFLNAEKNVKRARKDAAIAVAICRGDRNE